MLVRTSLTQHENAAEEAQSLAGHLREEIEHLTQLLERPLHSTDAEDMLFPNLAAHATAWAECQHLRLCLEEQAILRQAISAPGFRWGVDSAGMMASLEQSARLQVAPLRAEIDHAMEHDRQTIARLHKQVLRARGQFEETSPPSASRPSMSRRPAAKR